MGGMFRIIARQVLEMLLDQHAVLKVLVERMPFEDVGSSARAPALSRARRHPSVVT